jgi:hypothetical protein
MGQAAAVYAAASCPAGMQQPRPDSQYTYHQIRDNMAFDKHRHEPGSMIAGRSRAVEPAWLS